MDDVAITMRWSDFKREKIRTILRILKLCIQTGTQKQRNRQEQAEQTHGQARIQENPVSTASVHAHHQKEAGKQKGKHT